MEREPPAWQPFDPEEPGPGLLFGDDAETDEAARVLVVLAAAEAARESWAPRAALSLAKELARTRGRTLLADMGLTEPHLHETVGMANHEGMSDVFLWGASFERVAHSVEPGLLFAPAGTVVANPASVTESPRWDSVIDGFGKARATLAIYLPVGAPGAERLLDRATDVVVLATGDAWARMDREALTGRLRAVLGPAEPAGVTAGSEPGERSEPWRPASADGFRGEREREVAFGGAATGAQAGRARWSPWAFAGILLLLFVLLAAWRGWIDVPYLTPLLAGTGDMVETSEGAQASPTDRAPAAAPPETSPAPERNVAPAGPVRAYAFALAAYPDPDSARAQAEALRRRRPDVLFTVAPVEVNGRVFHRLLAGGARDPATAEALRSSLAGTFGGASARSWILRDARWAWGLGSDSTLAGAQGRAQDLQSRGIPAYVLELSTAGVPLYQVYAGAYANEAEAAVMKRIITDAGVTDATLIERRGQIPE